MYNASSVFVASSHLGPTFDHVTKVVCQVLGAERMLPVACWRIQDPPETEDRALPDLSGPSGNRRSGPSGSIGPLRKQKIGPFWICRALPETEDWALLDTEDRAP